MTRQEDFKLLKIQTYALKVNLHCDGCKQKVKKLLQRTEGVYQVNIDADQQKVTVSGSIDSASLIKKLIKAGKYAEDWSQKSSQTQKVKNNGNYIKHDNNNSKGPKQASIKGVQPFIKHQQKFPAFSCEEDDDDEDYSDEDDDDDDDDDDDEDELRHLGPSQLGLLRQQAINANNAKQIMGALAAASNNGNKMTNNLANGNAGKNGNPNQNIGIKVNPGGGLDPKIMAALKLNNAQVGRGNTNSVAAFGGHPNGLEGFQVQSSNNKGHQGSSAAGFPNVGNPTGQYPPPALSNINGYNHPASMMMNMQNRHVMQEQPQMMYHRSPFVPPTTGYYYNNSSPSAYYPPYSEQINYNADHSTATTYMFSDENTSSCSVM